MNGLLFVVNEQNAHLTRPTAVTPTPAPRIDDQAICFGYKMPEPEMIYDDVSTVATTTMGGGGPSSAVETQATKSSATQGTAPTHVRQRTLKKSNSLGGGSRAGTQRDLGEFDEMEEEDKGDMAAEHPKLRPAAADKSAAPPARWHQAWDHTEKKMDSSQERVEMLFEKQSARMAALEQRLGAVVLKHSQACRRWAATRICRGSRRP